jgi:hypothetical protein
MSPMNNKKYIICLCLIITLFYVYLYPQDRQDQREAQVKNPLLTEIAASIDSYKSKTITLRLKLKHVDKIFEKITFYDAKNHDIEFDISTRQIKKKLAVDMLNLHEGLDYNVTFTVQNIGNLGQIIAELKGFKPVLLDSVPDTIK